MVTIDRAFGAAVRWVLVLVALWAGTLGAMRMAHAQTPTISRPVTDQAGVLSPEAVGALEAGLRKHQAEQGAQVAVLLVGTTGGEPIEDYAHRVATTWKGGQAGKDDGVLFVLAVNDRRSRIEVGYGIESKLTDGTAKTILDSARPELRAGDYDGAVAKVTNAILSRLGASTPIVLPANRTPPARAPTPVPSTVPSTSSGDGCDGGGLVVFFFGFFGVLAMIIISAIRKGSSGGTTFSGSGYSSDSSSSFWSSSSSSSGSSWSSSSSSDSSWSSSSSSDYSGGGGDFGGGGASSDW